MPASQDTVPTRFAGHQGLHLQMTSWNCNEQQASIELEHSGNLHLGLKHLFPGRSCYKLC